MDAAVAAAFAATVCEPGLASLGGGGFLLVDDQDESVVYDFFVDAPGQGRAPDAHPPHMERIVIGFAATDQAFHAGLGSVAVPGTLDGLLDAHRAQGRLPLAEVIAPARAYAADGFELEPMQEVVFRLLSGIISLSRECRATYFPDGDRPRAGDIVTNRRLAEVLEGIGAGQITRFADLPGMDDLLESMRGAGAALTRADVDAYTTHHRAPLLVSHNDAELLTNPAPALGGPILAAATVLLSGSGEAVGEDPEGVARVVEALREATRQEKAAHSAGTAIARKGTTHVSVADSDGMAASLTQSNGSCSGIMVPGTGIHLNNVMGEEDLHPAGLHHASPGERISSMMAPSVLHLKDGSRVALGSGGSERIRSALLTVIVGLADRGLSISDAVRQPRLHWDGRIIQAEPGLRQSTLTRLRQIAPVAEWSEPDLFFGGVHVVRRAADGTTEAVGDARRGGSSVVIEVG